MQSNLLGAMVRHYVWIEQVYIVTDTNAKDTYSGVQGCIKLEPVFETKVTNTNRFHSQSRYVVPKMFEREWRIIGDQYEHDF